MISDEEGLSPDRLFPDGQCANSRQTLRIALNLKTLIDQVVPTVFPEKDITDSHSPVLNRKVIDLTYRAAGGAGGGKQGTSSYKYRSCLVFCLLKVTGWYWQQADYELSDNKLYSLRADPHSYVLYKGVASSKIRTHFDPERIKTPAYQNKLEIFFSFFYLALYTIILNTNQVQTTPVDMFESLFYVSTLGAVLDEMVKLYHVGRNYMGFWNVFNDTMYGIITVAIGFRFTSLSSQGDLKDHYDEMSFRILSCAAPLMWSRLLLYLDAQQFVGAMLVVIKTMMKESLLFFVLFAVVVLGFLQGFLGLDASDGKSQATKKILVSLINAVIGEAGLKDVLDLVPPYASVLYYIYSFVLTVILMNILIALYSTSYAAIVENATDEYFALVAQKTLRSYKTLNHYVMLLIYSPMLIYITVDELSNARRIQYNRFKGFPDDANEVNTEWDLTDGFDDDQDGSGWEGIRNRSMEINQVVQDQRAAEAEDPEFSIDLNKFNKDIQKLVQPVMKASEMGIKWELFDLYKKFDQLTELVTVVVEENKALKEKEPRTPERSNGMTLLFHFCFIHFV
ncbi:hypothetical protein HF325_004102 [Metschnikowia pulcherrima]|uniref:Ion transport domain-containing protein n=1 Tax=Metschnikowia pulcherrima TaxID=27326 RepID=A0A8H7L9C4_9ASCO|nr:hypothetical protein HF325_004102 [Metschnikowia pulcherrima]